jgi:hypothetical protein
MNIRIPLRTLARYAAAFLAGVILAGTVTAVAMAHGNPAPRPCTFDGGGRIASGDAARTTDGHVWACADGQLYRIDRPAS